MCLLYTETTGDTPEGCNKENPKMRDEYSAWFSLITHWLELLCHQIIIGGERGLFGMLLLKIN